MLKLLKSNLLFKKRFGDENIEVYHTSFRPLEWVIFSGHDINLCYINLIVNTNDKERVLGIHFLGPKAGEVVNGFVLPVSMGCTRQHLLDTLPIHPICAEEILQLKVTKREKEDVVKTGC